MTKKNFHYGILTQLSVPKFNDDLGLFMPTNHFSLNQINLKHQKDVLKRRASIQKERRKSILGLD